MPDVRVWSHSLIGANPSDVEGARIDRRTVRRVWQVARPYRRMMVGFLTVIVIAAGIDLLPPLIIRQVVDVAIPERDGGLVTTLALLMVGAALAQGFLSLVERWLSSRIGEGVIFDLRTRLFDHVQRMPVAFFTRTQTGALVSRLNNDVIGAQRALTGTLGSVFSYVITLTTTVIAMAVLEWRLTLLALVMVPIFIVPAKRVGRKLQAMTREGMDLNASMNTTMTERFNVAGAMLVKLFGRYPTESAEFSTRAGRVRDIGIRSSVYSRTFFMAMGLVGAVGTALVYLVGGHLVINDVITLGTLVALGTYVTRLYAPLTGLSNARVDIMSALVSFDRVFEVLDLPNPITDRPGAVELDRPAGRIELDHVWFRYPTAEEVSLASLESVTPNGSEAPAPRNVDRDGAGARPWVLKGVSATVEPGQAVALVGPSGGGKTTLSMLLARLGDVTRGAITIDGIDVRDLTQDSLHASIGVVTQDPHLFHDTVIANLRYARPEATMTEIEAAARAAQIHDVIAELPEGYSTIVGERGYRLSGGEKQRLAIARMLLKDPRIVILDEATSHLDSENEHLVQQALSTALTRRTAVVIAHRLSTITSADQILVLDDGEIVQLGSHDELLASGGLYADLYRTLLRTDLQASTSVSP
ncbi:MAG: ABC transporter ATP-binding protein [Acidimicrobiales bacterium]